MKKSALVLTVAGETIEEIREKLAGLCKQFGVSVGEGETVAAPAAGKPRGRKSKEESAQPAVAAQSATPAAASAPADADIFSDAPAAPAVPAAPAATPVASQMDLHNAMLAVQNKKGLQKAREIIAQVGAKRISEIKEADYSKVVQACNAALA